MNKTPKVVCVGCVGLWKHNGVLSEFGKIRETGKMCHVISIDDTCMGWFNVLMTEQEGEHAWGRCAVARFVRSVVSVPLRQF